MSVNRVINCTGPDTDIRRTGDPLLINLLAAKLVRPDALGLGLDTSVDGAVLSVDGMQSASIFTLGTPCKGRLWECTAVPELRVNAFDLARGLLEATSE
jgi:uncharacterized NAD(P)/FAD-binding protein YdhS